MVKKQFLALVILLAALSGCVWFFPPPAQIAVPDSVAEDALAVASAQAGKPYELGGRGPDRFDCSGLITWSYKRAAGRSDIFRWRNQTTTDASMMDLYRWNTEPVLPQDVIPGDIVFITDGTDTTTHGGLFMEWVDEGTFRFVNASSFAGEVVVDEWTMGEEIRGQEFVAFGRLLISR